MISLCITGHSAVAIAAAERALLAAGMAAAGPVQRDAAITFASWHDRVQQAISQSASSPIAEGASASMGRLWEQLASDLFLSNMQAPVWGWADAKSLGLLDYWLGFDASTHFVLLATSPEQMLAEHLSRLAQDGQSAQEPALDLPTDALMAQWSHTHQVMLRFALRHPTRCVLVQADDLKPQALLQALQAAWPDALKGLLLSAQTDQDGARVGGCSPTSVVLRHFATELCQAYPQAQTLKYEIASVALSATPPSSEDQAVKATLANLLTTVALAHQVPALLAQVQVSERDIAGHVNHLAELEVRLAQGARSNAQLQTELDAAHGACASLQLEKEALAQEVRRLGLALQTVQSVHDGEARDKVQALSELDIEKAQRAQAEEEREWLMAQLHQVQEELERYHRSNKALEEDAKIQATAQSDYEAKMTADLDALNVAFAQERVTLAQENLQLGDEKAKVIADRDAESMARAALQEKLADAGKAFAEVVHEKTALSQEKIQIVAARDAESRAKNAALADLSQAQARATLAEEDSALVLAQLHKLQEYAEGYDLRTKDLQAALNQSTARFRRMVCRQPDGIDWESVQVQPVLVDGRHVLQCRAMNVAVIDKEWKVLEFLAWIEDGVLAFNFRRGAGALGNGPLSHWPRALAAQPEFTARAGQDGDLGQALLKDLSSSDWDLLHGLPKLVTQGLQQLSGAWPSGLPEARAWKDAANATLPALIRVPMALRFDHFRLQSSTALPTVEYLKLCLEPLSLGKRRLPSLEFRLGCTLGRAGEFGGNARLEFFKGSSTPTFEQWAPNVRDAGDERLDLVFVFPTSMNLKDWNALSVNDRGLVLLLADQLPVLLSELDSRAVQLKRPMAAWIGLAEKLRTFVRARLDVTGLQKQDAPFVGSLAEMVPSLLDSSLAKSRARVGNVIADKPKAPTRPASARNAQSKLTHAAKKVPVQPAARRAARAAAPESARSK